jgi:hypothetical protein
VGGDGGASDEDAETIVETFGVVVFARVYEGEGDLEEGEEIIGCGGVGLAGMRVRY